MSVKESIQELRQRVFLLRGLKTPHEVAREMGLDGVTLRGWLRGNRNVTTTTLARSEEWCDAQDDAQHSGR